MNFFRLFLFLFFYSFQFYELNQVLIDSRTSGLIIIFGIFLFWSSTIEVESPSYDFRLPRSGGIPYIFKACEKSPSAGFVWHQSLRVRLNLIFFCISLWCASSMLPLTTVRSPRSVKIADAVVVGSSGLKNSHGDNRIKYFQELEINSKFITL